MTNNKNKPKNPNIPDEVAKFTAEITRIMAENRMFRQEKDGMLCTIACLVKRLGGRVVIGQEDAEIINKWLADQVTLTMEQIAVDQHRASYILTVEYKDAPATV